LAHDYYSLLGISRNASEDEIKKAYRRLARELHPDANGGDKDLEDRFKEITTAYETLRDAEKRRIYDTYGEDGLRGGMGDAGPFGAGINDIFGAFFGSAFGGGSGQAQRGPQRGADTEVYVDLSFTEAVFGVQKDVTLRLPVKCSTCSGSGAKPGTTASTCSVCGGTGQVRKVAQSILGRMVTTVTCDRCRGAGTIITTPCQDCRGDGRRTEERTYSVEVPAGVDNGSTLRLAGRGPAGPRSGLPGDLYVQIRVKPHHKFRREDSELRCELVIPLTQAVLGASLEFETLDGVEDLVIPEGTQSGTQFRLRGRGVPDVRGSGRRGDLVVTIVVEIPEHLDEQQDELFRRIADLRGEVVADRDHGIFSKIKSAFK